MPTASTSKGLPCAGIAMAPPSRRANHEPNTAVESQSRLVCRRCSTTAGDGARLRRHLQALRLSVPESGSLHRRADRLAHPVGSDLAEVSPLPLHLSRGTAVSRSLSAHPRPQSTRAHPSPDLRALLALPKIPCPGTRSGRIPIPRSDRPFAARCPRRPVLLLPGRPAARFYRQGLAWQRIEQALLLGCARKHVAWLNGHTGGPITSLSYFEPLIQEVRRQPVSDRYWDYLRSRLRTLSQQWKQQVADANFASATPSRKERRDDAFSTKERHAD